MLKYIEWMNSENENVVRNLSVFIYKAFMFHGSNSDVTFWK